jgi:ATP-binding protein involved in chromosome partitioning
MTEFEKLSLPDVKNIIVIASGKGGVGKSTVSANLAVALARQGYKVALVDADIYGPSIPKMFGIENEKPEGTAIGDKEMMLPVEKYGVKIMSAGFFIEKNQGLIWRGPLAGKALVQLFENTYWGEIDYLLVDFPPGTGDIQLSTIQNLEVTGAIMVTTPQEIALNDARKAASLFLNPDVNIPILGVVENMSWFTPAEHPGEKYFVFGQDGGGRLATELKTKLIGQIPLVIGVGEAAERGLSAFNQPDYSVIRAFEGVVDHLVNNNKAD